MKVSEIYELLGENYDEVFERIGMEDRIVKYLKKFITEDFGESVRNSYQSSNWSDLFKSAHDLKGLALNLGLSKLAYVSGCLCELVRNGDPKQDITSCLEKVEVVYSSTVGYIRQLD